MTRDDDRRDPESNLTAYCCRTCGTQFPPSDGPPVSCPICDDDRQYLPPDGQHWTSLSSAHGKHRNHFTEVEPGVTRLSTTPKFGIGQHAHLIETDRGNVLWDLIGYLDEATVAEIGRRGGVHAIVISHPHFFTTMVEWSRALGDVPIVLHEAHRKWVMRPDPAIHYWSGDTHEVVPGVTAIRTGGHFPGSTVLHRAGGVSGRHAAEPRAADGVLFTGDTFHVVADPRWVTFMYSYPNDIPLDAASVRRMVAMVEPNPFSRLYDAFEHQVVADASERVRLSAERYIAHLEGRVGPTID